MRYKFDRAEVKSPNGNVRKFPIFILYDESIYGEFFVSEIINLSSDIEYVTEIVDKLYLLKNGKLDFYEGFGFEIYMIVCDKENANVVNIFEGDRVEATLPTIELYEFMKDWRDYLLEWNKNNKSYG